MASSSLLRTLFFLHFFAPLVLGIFVPTSLPNGVYEINLVKDVTKLAPLTKNVKVTIAHYDMTEFEGVNVTAKYGDDRRSMPISHSHCPGPHHEGSYMQPAETRVAREMLSNWCEMYNPHGGGAVVAIYGDAAYYICNWTRRPRPGSGHTCSAWEANFAESKLDQWCGPNYGGFIQLGQFGIGYGRTPRDQFDICENLEKPSKGKWKGRRD